jgi:hypothetical protein
MHLVDALAAGVRGAENGTARIYVRGTSTRASWYEDYEGETVDSSGADIELDGEGRAVVYVNQVVRVDAYDSSGSEVVSFVCGDATPLVEYQGAAFTGTNYESGMTGAGSGYAVTLHTILARALTSFGSTDWQVLVDGVPTSLADAIGGMVGVLFNVKSPEFGAVGDGVTDDTTAIQAAIDAAEAAGGIVFFPAGEYLCLSAIDWPLAVQLVGAGASESMLAQGFNTGHLLVVEGSGNLNFPPRIALGLTFASLATNTSATVNVEDSVLVHFSHCAFTHQGTLAGVVLADASTTSQLTFDYCRFSVATTSSANMISSAGGAVVRATRCTFTAPASYTPGNATVYGNSITLQECTFTNSSATTGTILCVAFNSTTVTGAIRGCTFTNGGGATVTAITLGSYATASQFFEADNVFGTTVTAYSYTNGIAEPTGQVVLRTRETRVYRVSNAGDSTLDTPIKQYGVISILSTLAGDTSLIFDGVPPSGARGVILIRNEDGSNR